ncbi:unnamed protein product [Brugia timori]|uniref:Uncharacterized protein n=1 Tax=Brugia timori TaxID=42155 RepID=A0A0R3QA69_9BILA|nr:unnamed protein product [Brugia timori]
MLLGCTLIALSICGTFLKGKRSFCLMKYVMSSSTGLTNGQSFKLQSAVSVERTSFNSDGSRDKHARCSKAGREDSELAKVTAKLSPQLSSSVEVVTVDLISDQELISLYEERIPHSSVKYDDVLRKAVFLLREKTRIEEEVLGLRARNESLQQLNKTIREKSVRLVRVPFSFYLCFFFNNFTASS